MRDGHPEVGSPKTRVRITIKTIIIKAKTHDKSPPIKAIFKGASEKLTIPSIEYLKRDQWILVNSQLRRNVHLTQQ